MIRINLLPDEMRKSGGRKTAAAAPKAPSANQANVFIALILIVALGAAGALFFWSKSQVDAAQTTERELRNEQTRLQGEIDQLSPQAKKMRATMQKLEGQTAVLTALDPPQRVLWSQKLAYMSELIPADVFITRLEITENQQQVEIEESREAYEEWEDAGREGEAPVIQTKPIVTYSVRIHGLASGETNVEQFDNVLRFHDALKAHRTTNREGETVAFMDQFNETIEVEYVEATLYKGEYPVNEFVFVLRTLPPPEPKQDGEEAGQQQSGGGGEGV